MARRHRSARSKRGRGLYLENLGDRTLLSVTTCTLTNGVLQATFCNDQDVVEVDANPGAQAVQVLINNQPSSFPAAEVQSLRVSNLHLYDVVLLDTNLRLPLLLDGTVQGNAVSGWVAINPRGFAHQHTTSSNLLHWVINTYNYQTGWSIAYPVDTTSESSQPSASSGNTQENALTRLASSLSLASFTAASNSIAELGGHLFHYLSGTSNGVATTDMSSGHEGDSHAMSSDMQAGLGGSAHEAMTNPPAPAVEHKPG